MTAPSDRFAILLDGDLRPTDRLRRQLQGCRVFAADGGIRHAEALNLEPELWLGDFDSDDDDLRERHARVARRDYPRDKAMSDGEIAIRQALDEGARELVLAGALGGERSDHAIFNLTGALALAVERPDIRIVLTSGTEEALPVVPGVALRPDWPEGTIFSVAGFSIMSGLTVSGAKWPLDAVEVPFGSTWTLSNAVGKEMEIMLKEGRAVALCRFDKSSAPV